MRLIDADQLLKKLQKDPLFPLVEQYGISRVIETATTVDVDSLNAKHEDIGYEKGYRDGYAEALEVTDNTEHIRHGHWNERYDTRYHFECSICKYLHQYKDNYCPLCGAKMDEVSE